MITQEEKQLLLVDLCARLPYHVRVKVWLKDGTTEEGFYDFEHNYEDVMKDFFFYDKLNDLKPYLRPMSSMTEEEKIDYQAFFNYDGVEYPEEYIDWLNAHHFDYRGLIEKGLVIEVTEGNNPYKD